MMKIIHIAYLATLLVCATTLTAICTSTSDSYTVNVDVHYSNEYEDHVTFWTYNNECYWMYYSVDKGEYESYRDCDIIRSMSKASYSKFASSCDNTSRMIADVLTEYTADMNDIDTINMVSQFVNANVWYKEDCQNIVGFKEHYQFPVETLYLRTGDCEDSAILAVELLRLMGYDAEVVVSIDHALVGVNIDGEGERVTDFDGDSYLVVDPVAGTMAGEHTVDNMLVISKNFAIFKVTVFMSTVAFAIMIFIISMLEWIDRKP